MSVVKITNRSLLSLVRIVHPIVDTEPVDDYEHFDDQNLTTYAELKNVSLSELFKLEKSLWTEANNEAEFTSPEFTHRLQTTNNASVFEPDSYARQDSEPYFRSAIVKTEMVSQHALNVAPLKTVLANHADTARNDNTGSSDEHILYAGFVAVSDIIHINYNIMEESHCWEPPKEDIASEDKGAQSESMLDQIVTLSPRASDWQEENGDVYDVDEDIVKLSPGVPHRQEGNRDAHDGDKQGHGGPSSSACSPVDQDEQLLTSTVHNALLQEHGGPSSSACSPVDQDEQLLTSTVHNALLQKHSGPCSSACSPVDQDKQLLTSDGSSGADKSAHALRLKVICDVCEKSFSNTFSLKRHNERDDHGDNMFSCDVCNEGCETVRQLKRHKNIAHSDKQRICHECGMRFSAPSKLRRHQMSHSQEKPYKCDVCNATFKHKDTLKVHARSTEHGARC